MEGRVRRAPAPDREGLGHDLHRLDLQSGAVAAGHARDHRVARGSQHRGTDLQGQLRPDARRGCGPSTELRAPRRDLRCAARARERLELRLQLAQQGARFRGIWSGPGQTGAPVDGRPAASPTAAAATPWRSSPTRRKPKVSIACHREQRAVQRRLRRGVELRLAEAVALPITTRDSIAELMARRAPLKAAESFAMDANEGISTTHRQVPDFLSARGYTD